MIIIAILWTHIHSLLAMCGVSGTVFQSCLHVRGSNLSCADVLILMLLVVVVVAGRQVPAHKSVIIFYWVTTEKLLEALKVHSVIAPRFSVWCGLLSVSPKYECAAKHRGSCLM